MEILCEANVCTKVFFLKLNSVECTESVEYVDYYFLVIFIFNITENSILQIL